MLRVLFDKEEDMNWCKTETCENRWKQSLMGKAITQVRNVTEEREMSKTNKQTQLQFFLASFTLLRFGKCCVLKEAANRLRL